MSDWEMLRDAAGRLFADLAEDWRDESAAAAERAWAAIDEMGLPLALVPEDAGGFGLATEDALGLIRLAGQHALPVPLAETMVANRLRAEAGMQLADGPTTFAAGDFAVTSGHSALLWGAAMRSLQIAGALETILRLTILHTSERQQFGKPLSKFQVLQHSIAQLGAEVAAASAAADMATEAIAGSGDAQLPIAAARVRLGEAVGIATAIAHQLHGAIGFTKEHQLHRFTTQAWRWRDEFGGHVYWSQLLGRAALAAGGSGYWAFVTEAA